MKTGYIENIRVLTWISNLFQHRHIRVPPINKRVLLLGAGLFARSLHKAIVPFIADGLGRRTEFLAAVSSSEATRRRLRAMVDRDDTLPSELGGSSLTTSMEFLSARALLRESTSQQEAQQQAEAELEQVVTGCG